MPGLIKIKCRLIIRYLTPFFIIHCIADFCWLVMACILPIMAMSRVCRKCISIVLDAPKKSEVTGFLALGPAGNFLDSQDLLRGVEIGPIDMVNLCKSTNLSESI